MSEYVYRDRPAGNFHVVYNGSAPEIHRGNDTLAAVPPGAETLLGDLICWIQGSGVANNVRGGLPVSSTGTVAVSGAPTVLEVTSSGQVTVALPAGAPPFTIGGTFTVQSGSSNTSPVLASGGGEAALTKQSNSALKFAWGSYSFANIPITLATPTHVMMVVRNNDADIYVNGALVDQLAYPKDNNPVLTNNILLGGVGMDVVVSKFGLWNRPLNTIEVVKLSSGYDPTA